MNLFKVHDFFLTNTEDGKTRLGSDNTRIDTRLRNKWNSTASDERKKKRKKRILVIRMDGNQFGGLVKTGEQGPDVSDGT